MREKKTVLRFVVCDFNNERGKNCVFSLDSIEKAIQKAARKLQTKMKAKAGSFELNRTLITLIINAIRICNRPVEEQSAFDQFTTVIHQKTIFSRPDLTLASHFWFSVSLLSARFGSGNLSRGLCRLLGHTMCSQAFDATLI